ncbi:hypothetical protein M426DRAFT_13775 [Hypoxylon sp. CI-4A]|nr:hypothetical protein M426DRAFT_13775 [Hypoxylon sp. CI-4A]
MAAPRHDNDNDLAMDIDYPEIQGPAGSQIQSEGKPVSREIEMSIHEDTEMHVDTEMPEDEETYDDTEMYVETGTEGPELHGEVETSDDAMEIDEAEDPDVETDPTEEESLTVEELVQVFQNMTITDGPAPPKDIAVEETPAELRTQIHDLFKAGIIRHENQVYKLLRGKQVTNFEVRDGHIVIVSTLQKEYHKIPDFDDASSQ